MIIDISPPLSPQLAVWPGDVRLSRRVQTDMARGDASTGSSLNVTVHIGAHADAPSHYGRDGLTIDGVDLDAYVGPCQVVRVAVGPAAAIRPSDLRDEVRAPRVLLATDSCVDRTVFREDFAALSIELIDHLHDRGVRLVGIDTPSVDLYADADLPVHRRVFECDMRILEGLALRGVAAGEYDLIALPLRLTGFDGSPVRAVLRRSS